MKDGVCEGDKMRERKLEHSRWKQIEDGVMECVRKRKRTREESEGWSMDGGNTRTGINRWINK